MFKGKVILELLEEGRLKKKDVYEGISVSKGTLDNLINGNTLPNCDTLERLADYFNVPIDSFFERENCNCQMVGHIINGNGNNVSGDIASKSSEREIEHLKAMLAEKERLIQVLLKKNV